MIIKGFKSATIYINIKEKLKQLVFLRAISDDIFSKKIAIKP